MAGEIYLANTYFTNETAAKVRPVLLLKPNSFKDVIYLPLTSNTNTKGVSINNSNLKTGYLPKTSIVIYEKISVLVSCQRKPDRFVQLRTIGLIDKTCPGLCDIFMLT